MQDKSAERLQAENEELRLRLEEAEETMRAIRDGAVDAFVVDDPAGNQVYTLQGADRPYRLLVEQMRQGAATLGTDGTIVYCNQALADLLRVSHERLVGSALHEFVPTDERTDYELLLAQGRTRSGGGEANLRRTDGVRVPVFLTVNVLPLGCGAAIGLLVTDLTTQKHHEELNAAHDALREAVTDSKRAAEALVESDRRKDEFLATLAHELRNPLAPLRTSLELIRRADGDAAAVEQARQVADRQLGQLIRLVDDLLDVSRITRNKIELQRQHVELASVVQSAVEANDSFIQAAGHELSVALPTEKVWLDADPTRVAQVLANLLNNAAKYTMDHGRIWLTVEREGVDVVIRVRDTGIGIRAELLPRVFDMFAQIDSARERSQGGLGIGLSLVKQLVELHGGAVEAHSAGVGQGSEFVVRLPVATNSGPEDEPEADPLRRTVPALRILVVDDSVDAADSLAMLLRMMGHDANTAYDGPAALETTRTYRPDVVLLDIGLPGMSGYEVARQLRAQADLQRVRLVAITGWGQEEDRLRARESGFDHHLTKPADPAVLQTLLESLSKRRPRAARGQPGDAARTEE